MKFKSPFLDEREKLFEYSVGFVIFDSFPVNKGHCLIVPHRIYSDYFDSTSITRVTFYLLICLKYGVSSL